MLKFVPFPRTGTISKDWNYADELDQISFSKKLGIIGVGRFDGSKGAVFIFDVSTCKLKAVVIHNPIYIWSSPVIKSLAEINETSAVIAQAYGEPPGKPERYSLYLCRIHLKSGKNIWCKKFSNTKEIAGPIHTSHILRVNENLYTVAVQHYPSGNVSLIGFTADGKILYHKVYPFKGVARFGDLGWEKGTVIYSADGFSAYLFNATNGELIAAYKSPFCKNKECIAYDVKKDFINGCYILVGTERVKGDDWQVRIERICEKTNLSVDFNYSKNGLLVSFEGFSNNGKALSWVYDFGDGSIGYGQNITHLYPKPGNYTVILKVRDEKGNIAVEAKKIELKSVFKSISIPEIAVEKFPFCAKVELNKIEKVTATFENETLQKTGKTLVFCFTPNKTGKEKLVILTPFEKIEKGVKVLSQEDAIREYKKLELIRAFEKAGVELSEKLANKTIEVCKHYFSGAVEKKIKLLKEKLQSAFEGEISKFAEKLAEYSETVAREVKAHKKEIAESVTEKIFSYLDELVKKGEVSLRKALRKAIYDALFAENLEKLRNKTLNLDEISHVMYIAKNMENVPAYELKLAFIKASPTPEFFLEKTEKSTEVGEIMAPWDLFDLLAADAQAVMLVPAKLGYLEKPELKAEFAVAGVAIAIAKAVEAYIALSTAISKISPALLLGASYLSSNMVFENVANTFGKTKLSQKWVSVLSKEDVKESIAITDFSVKSRKVVFSVNVSTQEPGIVFVVVKGANLTPITFVNFTESPVLLKYRIENYTKDVCIKAYLMHFDQSIKASVFVSKGFAGICSAGMSEAEKNILIIKNGEGEKDVEIRTGNESVKIFLKNFEEKEIALPKTKEIEICYSNHCEIERVLLSTEAVKNKKAELVLPSKLFINSGGKIIFSTLSGREANITLISPSGKIYTISTGKAFCPRENGTWEMKSSEDSFFFVVEKPSELRCLIFNTTAVVLNNKGRFVENARVVAEGEMTFTDASGSAKFSQNVSEGYAEKAGYLAAACVKPVISVPEEVRIINSTCDVLLVKRISENEYFISCTGKGASFSLVFPKNKSFSGKEGNYTFVLERKSERNASITIIPDIIFTKILIGDGMYKVCAFYETIKLCRSIKNGEVLLFSAALKKVEIDNTSFQINLPGKLEKGVNYLKLVSPYEIIELKTTPAEIKAEVVTSSAKYVIELKSAALREEFFSDKCVFFRSLKEGREHSIVKGNCSKVVDFRRAVDFLS